MLILGIESATEQVGCAIGGHEGVLASAHVCRGKRHAETLVPAIEFLCEQVHIEMQEISVVAVDLGPGLFTGLRVGIATAKSIAQALRVPMIGINSLDLLAFPVRFSPKLIVPVVDARRGEVFSAQYRQVPGGVQRLTEPQVCTAEDLVSELMVSNEDCLLVGDGALRYADVFGELNRMQVVEDGLAHPLASSLVQLAHSMALREEFVNARELEPLYLRRPDVDMSGKRRGAW